MPTQKECYSWPTRLGITVSFGAWTTGNISNSMRRGTVLTGLIMLGLLCMLSPILLQSMAQPIIMLRMCAGGCGLGNQMFIYASGLGMALKYPNAIMCITGLNETVNQLHPKSVLILNVELVSHKLEACTALGGWWWMLQHRWSLILGLTTRFEPPHTKYVPFMFNAQNTIFIDANLESFKYFRHVPHPIFRLKQYDQAKAWLTGQNITSVVHVRRGDKFQSGQSVAPLEYYERALRMLPSGPIAVCTDDPWWVKQQLIFRNASVSVNNDPGFDMAVLAAATDTVVIGVGTFAWWGAYLSKARRKLFYPVQFKGEDSEKYSERDFIPYHVPGQGEWVPVHV